MYQLKDDLILPKILGVVNVFNQTFESLEQVYDDIRTHLLLMIKRIYYANRCIILCRKPANDIPISEYHIPRPIYEIPISGWISLTFDSHPIKLIYDRDDYFMKYHHDRIKGWELENEDEPIFRDFLYRLASDEIRKDQLIQIDKDVYELEFNQHKLRIKLNFPAYFLEFDRGGGGRDEFYWIAAHAEGELGKIYDWVKKYVMSNLNEMFCYGTYITIWLPDDSCIKIKDHLKLMRDDIMVPKKELSCGTDLARVLWDLEFNYAYKNYAYRTTDNICNIKLDQFVIKSGVAPHFESLRIVFDFPNYFQCFRSLLLISFRYNISIPRDIFKIIMSYI